MTNVNTSAVLIRIKTSYGDILVEVFAETRVTTHVQTGQWGVWPLVGLFPKRSPAAQGDVLWTSKSSGSSG